MSDEIIDIQRYLDREGSGSTAPGSMALWGADGDRSRLALPLWRIVHLASAERGVIFWREIESGQPSRPFVVIDLARDPPRLSVEAPRLPALEPAAASLYDLGSGGIVVCLGARAGRVWYLLADGRRGQEDALPATTRENMLFLAGECAGLLFLRDLADDVERRDD